MFKFPSSNIKALYKNMFKKYMQETRYLHKNTKVYLDISIDSKISGRMTIELFAKEVPRTSLNFYHLCKGDKKSEDGKVLHYKNCIFHRIIPGFMCQSGDFINGNGTGGYSIYGRTFGDENFVYSHDSAGLLSMANRGPNTNSSQFFITTADCGWLDGKHVVFGKVTDGIEVLNAIEACGSDSGKAKKQVIISDCGVLDDIKI